MKPRIHRRSFRVRYNECDAFGHLNNAHYLRYMQEAAFDASTAAGWSFERYDEVGLHWLVRETEIEYLKPLRYNDEVEVTTWVSDFRRASSRRSYQFQRLADEELVAHAWTDWVLVDAAGRPSQISAAMRAAFYPNGEPESYPPRPIRPAIPTPPPDVFRSQRTVLWRDLDTMQHVNNAMYAEYLEEAGFQVVAAHHWPLDRMLRDGFAILLRSQRLQYLAPSGLGEPLDIATWVSEVRRTSAWRNYVLTGPGETRPRLRAQALGAWVDLASGRPRRIPAQMLADFAPNIVPSPIVTETR
jgi:acyl-CoA thioester hydrolase